MPLQPCLTCGQPSPGPRCRDHAIDTRRMRDQPELRRAAAAVRAAARTCWICGRPFTASDPPTADHVTPLIAGGALLGELRPAHRSCNSSRGARDQAGEMEVPPPGLRIAPARGERSGFAASRSGGSTRIAGGAGGATTTDGELAAQHTPGGSEKSLDGAEPPGHVGSSRVDLQACKLEYSIVSPK